MPRFARLPATLVGLLVAVGCVGPAPASPAPTPAPAAHWSYEGEEGPAHWAELSPDYAACAAGREQSPIDINEPVARDLPPIAFDYRPAPLEIVNNGHTIQVGYAPGSSIELEGTRYELLQFHFHLPSEHLVGGAAAAGELHLVHSSESAALAVVGVLLVEGEHNPALEPVISNLPLQPGPAETVAGVEVDAVELLPREQATYRYAGSLTTPPCSEGVQWLLMAEPVEASPEQLDALAELLEGNARPVQPLHEREVEQDTTP